MYNSKIKDYLKYVILCILLCLFTIIIINIFNGNIKTLDSNMYNYLSQFINDRNTYIFKFITIFGSWYTLIFISLLLLIFIKNKKIKYLVPVNLICSFLVNYMIKNIIRRPRPNLFPLVKETGFSFPSGHSMVSTAFYGFLIYLIYKYVRNKILKCFLIVFLTILILLICISRVYLNVHYISDVFGGIILAIIYLIIFI